MGNKFRAGLRGWIALALLLGGCGHSSSTESDDPKTQNTLKRVEVRLAQPLVEEGRSADVTIVIDQLAPQALTLQWDVLSPAGRMEAEHGAVVIGEGKTSATFTLALKANAVYDGAQLARVQVYDPSSTFQKVEFQLGLGDDDPMPFVSIADSEGLRGSTLDFNVTLSETSGVPTTVNWRTVDVTAKAGVDYTAAAGTLVIPAGAAGGLIQVPTFPLAAESSFLLQLTGIDGARLADSSATARILAGDTLDTTVSFTTAESEYAESAGAVGVEVKLSNPISRDIVVSFVASGSAHPGDDFRLSSNQVTIPAGATTASIPVEIIDDGLYESQEDLVLRITAATNAGFGSVLQHRLKINDNDPLPQLSLSDAQGEEGQTLNFAATLDRASGVDTYFSYKLVAGSADETRYRSVAGTITIPEGSTVATLPVVTVDDAMFEDVSTFTMVITQISGASLRKASGIGTILDNDTMPKVQFVLSSQTTLPAQSVVSVVVELSEISGAATSVPFTVGGNSIAGVDHNLAPSVFRIPAGVKSATLDFNVFTHAPPERQVILQLYSPVHAQLGGITSHTVKF